MLLLVSATWPERALLRAQLEEDTHREVIATDTTDAAADWLAERRLELVIIDTQGLSPDVRFVEALRVHRPPVLLVASAFDRQDWETALAEIDLREALMRPMFIGDVSRAVMRSLERR